MIKNFKIIFGAPEDVLIVFGDYGLRNTMKGCEPHISRRLRRILKNAGYELYEWATPTSLREGTKVPRSG